jgi:hypothetical protein
MEFDYARFGAFTAMKINVVVFGVATPCSDTRTIHPEDGGSMVLRNVGFLSHRYTVLQLRITPMEFKYFKTGFMMHLVNTMLKLRFRGAWNFLTGQVNMDCSRKILYQAFNI